MTQPESSPNPQQYAEAIAHQARTHIRAAMEVLHPENPDADPCQVLPAPTEKRDEGGEIELSPAQEQQLRSAVAELGFGREYDKSLSERGLSGAAVVIEGGQPHKILAEAQMVLEDEAANPSRLYFAATPHRKITSPAEAASAERLLGEVPATEYDVAKAMAQQLQGFVAEEYDLPYGYDIHNNFAVTNETTGQFKMVGWVGKTPVVLMRIDREYYMEGDQQKYRNQPGTADVVQIVDAVQRQDGDVLSPIGLVTSATYEPSRQIDCTRAGLAVQRPVGVAAYGTARLSAVKGEDAPVPAALNQLPGELYKVSENVQKLEAVIASHE